MDRNDYLLSRKEILTKYQSQADGLTQVEVTKRQAQGKNTLTAKQKTTLWQKFLAQFKDLMIIILLVAALVSAFAGEVADAIIIFIVVILNAIFGVFQEAKAENAIAALQKMTSPTSRVKRDGQVQHIASADLVVGDIVLLEAGDVIPADVRFLETTALKVEEAALTGESVAVEKTANQLRQPDLSLGEQANLGFMNTNVTYGTATAIVTRIGMQTQVGQIAQMLDKVEKQSTPLQKSITHLSKLLTILILVIAVVIFTFGILMHRASFLDMLLTAISLAVAAIPEGLPAIVTITLALGTQAMSKRNALVRKLPAVETLGATEIIASDKTGTLTQNKMTVEQFYQDGKLQAAQDFLGDANNHLTWAMILANDAVLTANGLSGDPTETALIQYYLSENKLDVTALENRLVRVRSLPFDSERKLMSAIVQDRETGKYYVLTKGAPDELLKRSEKIEIDGQVHKLDENWRQDILQQNHALALKALRVLAYAYKEISAVPAEPQSVTEENNLIFVGLTGMIDPERPEVKAAVAEAKKAGLRPLMITGDHKDTATAIALRLGILDQVDASRVITGSQLDQMTDEELRQKVDQYSVYARVAPEHKVRIVKAWQAHDKVVAMTGDGVNDAPALKTADIGVGMGITGTEVSKNAADIILADDNFATIITAVRAGRKVYANIQKAIQYLLSANLGEVLTLTMMTFLGWNILAPVQILWINLVTDTFPAIALGVEKEEPGLMAKKPRGLKTNFLSHGVGIGIVYQGLLEGILTLGVYWYALNFPYHTNDVAIHADALTMAYATLGILQLVHAFNCKSLTGTIFTRQIFNNRAFNGAIILSALLLCLTIFVPALNGIFHVTSLAWSQWVVVLGAAVCLVVIVELVKAIQRRK